MRKSTGPYLLKFPRQVLPLAGSLSVLLCVAPFVLSQTDSPKPAPAQTTVVTVNEVSLNLVVRDKKGKLISDLKPEDIAVTDGGSAVKVSTLHLVTGDAGEHRLTFVFDRLDLASGYNAREIATKILKMVPQSGFTVSVMTAEARLMLYQDFTSDRQRLADAVALATDEEKSLGGKSAAGAEKHLIAIAQTGNDESGKRATDDERATAQVVLAALQESQRVVQELHAQPALAGLLALARTEQRLPGRKTVVYFSQGLQTEASTGQRLQDIVGAANRSGVSIYVIDANALTAQADQSMVAMMAIGNVKSARAQAPPTPTTAAGSGGLPQTTPQPPPGLAPMAANQFDRFETADPNANRSPLIGMAESTGGAYVGAGGDVKKPLRQLIEDMTTYYEASYTSPVENYDGQFRPIAVKPVRQGLRISSRAGYFALPPDAGRTMRPFEAPLMRVLAETQLPTDVSYQAKVLRLGNLPTGDEDSVVVEIPVSSLETLNDPNANLYSLHVSVVAQIKNKAGKVVEQFGEDIPRHGSLSAKDAQPQSITMQRHFTAEPGDYVLETAVLDQDSGKTGAQRTEFQIPGATEGPFLSDLTMVQRIDPVPEEADPMEPMRYGKGRVVPSASDRVMKGAKELSFFFFVHPGADSGEDPRLEMEVMKSGEAIAQVPLALRKTDGPATIPYMASIQAGGLSGGEYRVIERLTQGDKVAERELSFRIEGNEIAEKTNEATGKGSAGDEAETTETGMRVPESDGTSGSGVVITTLPADAVPPPTPDQLERIVEGARKRALEYSKSLPNFLCVEYTNRSADTTGKGTWKHRDSLAELLTYHDNAESRTTLEMNGKRSSLKRADMNSSWPLSEGEFGAMLNLVFKAGSKAVFEWKEAATLGDQSGTLQVLAYHVARENATMVLNQGNEEEAVGFHGLVYIDAATGGVRRVTLEGDGIKRTFAIRAAAMSVDYDYVAISGRDYLMPVRSSMSIERAHKKTELNEITFRNYRRYASRAKIKMVQ